MTRDDGYTRYTVRIPTPLYERVKQAAGEASVNSLVVEALEEKFPAQTSPIISEEALAIARKILEASDQESLAMLDELNAELAKGPVRIVAEFSYGKLQFVFPDIKVPGFEPKVAVRNSAALGESPTFHEDVPAFSRVSPSNDPREVSEGQGGGDASPGRPKRKIRIRGGQVDQGKGRDEPRG